jgi:hypothetical protein
MSLYNGGATTGTDQNGIFISGGDISVSNFRVAGSKGTGILFYPADNYSNISFTNGIVTGTTNNGAMFAFCDGNTLSNINFNNVAFTNNGAYGIDIFTSGDWMDCGGEVSDLKIINPTFSSNSSGDIDTTATAALGKYIVTGPLQTDDVLYGDSLQLSGTGNVGIGVSNPTKKLSVDGTIYFNPVSLSADGGGGSKLGINVDGTIYKY